MCRMIQADASTELKSINGLLTQCSFTTTGPTVNEQKISKRSTGTSHGSSAGSTRGQRSEYRRDPETRKSTDTERPVGAAWHTMEHFPRFLTPTDVTR